MVSTIVYPWPEGNGDDELARRDVRDVTTDLLPATNRIRAGSKTVRQWLASVTLSKSPDSLPHCGALGLHHRYVYVDLRRNEIVHVLRRRGPRARREHDACASSPGASRTLPRGLETIWEVRTYSARRPSCCVRRRPRSSSERRQREGAPRRDRPTRSIMKPMSSAGGWKAIALHVPHGEPGRVDATLACHAEPERVQDAARWEWAGRWAEWSTRSGHFPEVCKKSLQAMASDMQEPGLARFLRAVLRLPAANPLTPRTGVLRPARRPCLRRCRGHPLSRDRLGRGARAARRTTERDRSRTQLLPTRVAGRRTKLDFSCSCSRERSGPTTSTTAPSYCHQASGVGLASSLGTGTATVQLEDLERSDLFVLIGGNPASNHPRLLRSLMTMLAPRRQRHRDQSGARDRSRQLPRAERPAEPVVRTRIASVYVQPHIGGDIALLTGVAKHVLERWSATARSSNSTPTGSRSSGARVESTAWSDIETAAGVPRESIRSRRRDVHVGQERGDWLDDGHHAPSARRRERADDRQSGPAAGHDRPAQCRSDADPGTQQRPGDGFGRRDAATEAGDR